MQDNGAAQMIQILRDGLVELGLSVTPQQLEQFEKYYGLLLNYNTRMNLTALTKPDEVAVKHFLDCVSLLKHLEIPASSKVIDVGSGAGFPGLPIAILRPDLRLTLLDSLNKRVEFLQVCAQELGLAHVVCIHGRAEDAAQNPDYREQFDFVVARAVANMRTLCEYCLPFLRIGGCFAAMKGPSGVQELEEAQRAILMLGGGTTARIDTKIPFSDFSHCILLVDKKSQTPSKFPRKGGKPTKNPL